MFRECEMDHHSGSQDRAIIEYLWFSGKGSRIDNPQPNSSPEFSPPKHWPGEGSLGWTAFYPGDVSTSTTRTGRKGACNTLTGPGRSSPRGLSPAGMGIIVCLSFVNVSHHGAASIPSPFLAHAPDLCHGRPGLRPFRRGRLCSGRLFRPGSHPGGSLVAPSRCR